MSAAAEPDDGTAPPSPSAGRGRRVVGAIGGPAVAVDRGGGLRLPGGARFEWWIGADDRWRFPSREVASRQRLVDGLPVVETAVRVPSGDAVQRVWVVPGPVPVAVMEIENASPAPFAVALATEGDVALGLARPVGAAAHGASLDELRRTVTGGGAVLARAVGAPPVNGDGPAAAAPAPGPSPAVARLVPIAHRTSLRVAVALGPGTPPDPDGLPGADVVVRGWWAVLDRTARVTVPDEAVQEAILTARSRLLLPLDDAERHAPDRLAALAAWGFPQEVVALGHRPAAPGTGGPAGPAPTDPTGAWDALGPPGDPAFLLRLRALLVDDGAGPSGLGLLPGWPPSWAGQPVEVHDLPTAAGALAFAVRWHGERPALLWDVQALAAPPPLIGTGEIDDPPPPAPPVTPPGDLRLTAPALDPAWTGHGPTGEALLGPPPRPGAVAAGA